MENKSDERFKLHQPAPVFHRKGTLGELVTESRKDPKCVDGCGHARSQHVISETTLMGYCAAGNCACTKFDNFAIEYGDTNGK
jgi:hypothetical protein